MKWVITAVVAGLLAAFGVAGWMAYGQPESGSLPAVERAELVYFDPDVTGQVIRSALLDEPRDVDSYPAWYSDPELVDDLVKLVDAERLTDSVYVALPVPGGCYRPTSAKLVHRGIDYRAEKIGRDTPPNLNCARSYRGLAVFAVPRGEVPRNLRLYGQPPAAHAGPSGIDVSPTG